jgi:hypothetical protein
VQNSACLKDARYCYTYLELAFTFADGTRMVRILIVGARTF